MSTINDEIRRKNEKRKNWEKENPGLQWSNEEHPEDEPKIFIQRAMLSNPAFRSLSKWALKVYLDLLGKRIMKQIKRNRKKYWICENNGRIKYPYWEAKENGIGGREFRNAIDELQQKGFIDITHLGQGGRKPALGTSGDSTLYWIDDRWKYYGTNEFGPPRKPRIKDIRTGRGWSLYWSKLSPQEKKNFIENRKRKKT